jgi:hypothetical protein
MAMHEKIARYFEGKEQFYPAELEAKYIRIFNRIMELWETVELEEYLSELMVDKRGGRQGFPPDVLNDILTLSRIHGRILELDQRYRPTLIASRADRVQPQGFRPRDPNRQ